MSNLCYNSNLKEFNIKNIAVIIINYKSEDVIANSINSIQEEFLDLSILILDNGSTDESYNSLLPLLNENTEIIRSKENLGYSLGANFAYMYLRKNNIVPKYIFFLNPDAIIQKNMIFNLFTILENNTDAAAVSPKIMETVNKEQYIGTNINWRKCEIIAYNIPKVDDTTHIAFVDVFHGAAVLINAELFYKVGMFDKKIFMYYDEAFLSMKFTKLSYKIIYSQDNIIHHYGSHSFGKVSFNKAYYHTRNHLLFFKKYQDKSNAFCKYRIVIIKILSSVKHMRFTALLGTLRGTWDFWMGKTGMKK